MNFLSKYVTFKRSKISYLLLLIFAALFVYFILQPALYSPDSYSYLRGDFNRFPGYVIFTRLITIIFRDYFDVAAIGIQLFIGFTAVFIILQKASNLFKLNIWLRIGLFLILIFPFFPPLSIANNITSESFAYSFYLMFISFTLDFLFRQQRRKIVHLTVCFLLLSLTRGQFILIPPIIALLYLFKFKKESFKRPKLFYFLWLLILPLVVSNLNKGYNKIIYGHYVATPFSFVNTVALPLFVANKSDAQFIEKEEDRIIFLKSIRQMDSTGLISYKVKGNAKEKYKVFHTYFPQICNQNIYVHALEFYRNRDGISTSNSVNIEQSCKRIFTVLVKQNVGEYVTLYFTGLIYGFKSIYILIFVVLVFLYSIWMCYKDFTIENAALLLFTTLILTNAGLVAVACHSIIRYLFYNYCLGFIIIVILFRKFTKQRWT